METRRCNIDNLDIVFEEFIEVPYTQEVRNAVKNGVRKTARDMAKQTRKDAHVDDGEWESEGFPKHRDHGKFRDHITWRGEQVGIDGYKATWYVRSPEHRLTHLLVGGHAQYVFGMKSKKHPYYKGKNWLKPAVDQAERDLVDNVKRELNK